MLVSGYAAPGNKAELLIDDKVVRIVEVEDNGLYRIDIDTAILTLGTHEIKTRQVDNETGKTGSNSISKPIRIGLFGISNCDLNDDSGVSISDWSIFLVNWFGGSQEEKEKIDLDGDGKIGIQDFSLFLQCWRLNN